MHIRLSGNMFTEALPRIGSTLCNIIFALQSVPNFVSIVLWWAVFQQFGEHSYLYVQVIATKQ
jgi:hypothetical protein